tara:strand:+ start:58 stop:759 length:702 start_codon:yes stop_codon:yes gene_type:complete
MTKPSIQRTREFLECLHIPESQRDTQSEQHLLELLKDAAFLAAEPPILQGPDGFPYIRLLNPPENTAFPAQSVRALSDFAIEGGFGILLDLVNPAFQWVMHYGDILSLSLFDSFDKSSVNQLHKGPYALQAGSVLFYGDPAPDVLPKKTRIVIRQFIQDIFQIEDPGVLLFYADENEALGEDPSLIFNVRRSAFSSDEQLKEHLNLLSWFLPRHYSVIAIGEEDIPKYDFFPL